MRFLHECLNRRYTRIGVLLILDMAIVALSYFASFWLRIDLLETRSLAVYGNQYHLYALPLLLAIRIGCNVLFSLYSWSFSHAGLAEGMRLFASILTGTIVFFVLAHGLGALAHPPPRSIYVLEGALTFFGMTVIRFLPGYLLILSAQRVQLHALNNNEAIRTLVYGNSGAAAMLVNELLRTHGHGVAVMGLLDDNPAHVNSSFYGVQVLGGLADLKAILKHKSIEQILLVGGELPGSVMRTLVDTCGPLRVKLKRVPEYSRLLRSAGVSSALKDVDPEALLDRRPVSFDGVDIAHLLRGKTVLVTGAGGTIGSELCRQVAGLGVKRLLLFDINENALFYLENDLQEAFPECESILLIGSVRDSNRVDEIMSRYRPEVVFHAAAHKHVPVLEHAPREAVKNNVLGTYEVAASALKHGVERFVFISTDKAASRANILGLSKRLAELVIKSLNGKGRTEFQIVRFGNVLDSNGSLVDIVRRQIAKGGPVTITHRDMERYFMTIPEAVGLVLVASAIGEGEISVLDMGEPIKIDTLVRQLIYLSGLIPEQDIQIRYTQPRAGEQLREALYRPDETIRDSSFARIKIVTDPEQVDLNAMLTDAQSTIAQEDETPSRDFFLRWVR